MPTRPPKPDADLNVRQVAFAVLYAQTGNGTRSAISAGYAEKAAAAQACHLLKNPKIQALIEQEKAARWKRLAMPGDEVLARSAILARSNIKVVVDEAGRIKKPNELEDLDAYQVASIKARLQFAEDGAPPEEIVEIKMRDPTPHLRLLAQHHGIIGADTQVNIGTELADRLAKARKRNRQEREAA